MKLGLLSNENLPRNINWTTLSDSLYREIELIADAVRIAPPPLSLSDLPAYLDSVVRAHKVDALVSVSGAWRPEWPLVAISALAGKVLRANFYVDPWKQELPKVRRADRWFRHDLSLIPYSEALNCLRDTTSQQGDYRYLPFAADTRIFRERGFERTTDLLWLGRRYDPLHASIRAYADRKGLNYQYRETTGFIADPEELGRLTSQSRYFVCTPSDLGGSRSTGGFSPLIMRYFEGLASGCRLLGVLPRSGEFQALLPRDSILEVAADGSDFAERFEMDQTDRSWLPGLRQAIEITRRDHGWDTRARSVVNAIRSKISN